MNREKTLLRLKSNHDGILKLLFAKLPHPQDLKLFAQSHATRSTHSWLKALIAASKALHPKPKPTQGTESEDLHTRDETA